MSRFNSCIAAILFLCCLLYGYAHAQSATNDPAARFVDGMFSLPELASPDQNYVIVIDESGAKPRDPIVLPKGVTAIRLAKQAVPTGSWTWRYAVTPQAAAAIQRLAGSGAAGARRAGDRLQAGFQPSVVESVAAQRAAGKVHLLQAQPAQPRLQHGVAGQQLQHRRALAIAAG